MREINVTKGLAFKNIAIVVLDGHFRSVKSTGQAFPPVRGVKHLLDQDALNTLFEEGVFEIREDAVTKKAVIGGGKTSP